MSQDLSPSPDDEPTLSATLESGNDVLEAYGEKIEAGEGLTREEMETWMTASALKTGAVGFTHSDLSVDEAAGLLEEAADILREANVEE